MDARTSKRGCCGQSTIDSTGEEAEASLRRRRNSARISTAAPAAPTSSHAIQFTRAVGPVGVGVRVWVCGCGWVWGASTQASIHSHTRRFLSIPTHPAGSERPAPPQAEPGGHRRRSWRRRRRGAGTRARGCRLRRGRPPPRGAHPLGGLVSFVWLGGCVCVKEGEGGGVMDGEEERDRQTDRKIDRQAQPPYPPRAP